MLETTEIRLQDLKRNMRYSLVHLKLERLRRSGLVEYQFQLMTCLPHLPYPQRLYLET